MTEFILKTVLWLAAGAHGAGILILALLGAVVIIGGICAAFYVLDSAAYRPMWVFHITMLGCFVFAMTGMGYSIHVGGAYGRLFSDCYQIDNSVDDAVGYTLMCTSRDNIDEDFPPHEIRAINLEPWLRAPFK